MPNWATVEYVFVGKEEDCKAAQAQLQAAFDIETAAPIGQGLFLLNAFIYPEHYELEDLAQNIGQYIPIYDCRGRFLDIDEEPYSIADNLFAVGCYTEEAWYAHPWIMYHFAQKHNLSVNFICEEPGMGLYSYWSPDHVFDDDLWKIDISSKHEDDYYNTSDLFDRDNKPTEIITTLMDGQFARWCKEQNQTITPENIQQLARKFSGVVLRDTEDWLGIYEFEEDNTLPILKVQPPPYDPPENEL